MTASGYTAADVERLRRAWSLSEHDMAVALGLAGGRAVRRIKESGVLTGPAATVLELLEQRVSDDDRTRWLTARGVRFLRGRSGRPAA